MDLLFLAAALPYLLWDKGPDTVETLRAAKIPCIAVPAEGVKRWAPSGFCVTGVPDEGLVKLPVPGVRWGTRGAGTASATSAPWLDTNGWRVVRQPGKKYVYETTRDSVMLSTAEAYVYGAEAYLRVDPQDLPSLGGLLQYCKGVPEGPSLSPAANIAIEDTGSPLLPEILNLLMRRNLLFRIVKAPDPAADLNVSIGSTAFPNAMAANPATFADEVRKKLTDRKRLLRVFGSEVVIGRLLTGKGAARIHLLNYTSRPVEELRVRVLGSYAISRTAVFGYPEAVPTEYVVENGATEFTLPVMGVLATIDLKGR